MAEWQQEQVEGGRLVAHVDSGIVTYDQLKNYVPPPATRTWRPLAHIELVDGIKDGLAALGLEVNREVFAVSHNGLKLFGIMDLKGELIPGIGKTLGFRHGNDKQIKVKLVSGGRVFVCDNMSLSGESTVLDRFHKWNWTLRDDLCRALDRFQDQSVELGHLIERAQARSITDESAKSTLADLLFDGTVTYQIFKVAYDTYFEKATRLPEEYADSAPRSAWGLHNALTRALKLSTPNVQFRQTIELGKKLGVWSTN